MLSDDEIKVALGLTMKLHECVRRDAHAIIAAVLDKLTAGVEAPEPTLNGVGWSQGYFDRVQLLVYGASQRLAGRAQAIEEAMRVTLAYQLGELEDTDDWPNLIAAAIEQLKGQP